MKTFSTYWRHYLIPRHQGRFHVKALGEEPDGTIWAGLNGGGLLQFKKDKFVPVSGSSSAGSIVHALVTDREGKMWIGTDAGLSRMRRKTLFTLSQPEGLGLGPVQGLAEISPGVVWVAKTNEGLYRWDGRNFTRLSAKGLSARVCRNGGQRRAALRSYFNVGAAPLPTLRLLLTDHENVMTIILDFGLLTYVYVPQLVLRGVSSRDDPEDGASGGPCGLGS